MRHSPSPAPPNNRPKSSLFPSPLLPPTTSSSTPPHSGHVRGNSSEGGFGRGTQETSLAKPEHMRNLSKSNNRNSGTFAPSFIKTEDLRRGPDVVSGIEGENDFSGKRYVWLKDPQTAFVKGWVVEDLGGNRILVQCDDGSVSGMYWPSDSRSIILTSIYSNEKLTPRAPTKSTRPSSTRPMTWPS